MPTVDLYSNEPHRDPRLVVRSNKPYNAETPLPAYSERLTPNELFYVRNHLPVPDVDPSRCDTDNALSLLTTNVGTFWKWSWRASPR